MRNKTRCKNGYLVINLEDNILCFRAGNDEVYSQTYFKRFARGTQRGYGVEVTPMVAGIESCCQKVAEFANGINPLRLRPFSYYLRNPLFYNVLEGTDSLLKMWPAETATLVICPLWLARARKNCFIGHTLKS